MNDTQKSPILEYLCIMKFSDQENKPYAVTIHDDEELWHDPQVMDIYPLA
jgi:hypothetical protein